LQAKSENLSAMTNEQLIEKLSSAYPEAVVKQGAQYPEITVSFDTMHSFMQTIKSDSQLAFDYLVCQSGVDYPAFIQVVYHLESTTHQHFIVVKANTENRETPVLDSVSDIWPTAEFHENEIYDLLGITFNNHPHLRRLFLDEGWGYPLRKDFKDDIHVVER
jgi:NADH:ubiquinone oxidoreductase subunit C